MGSRAVEELAAEPDVEQVTIADRERMTADAHAHRIGGCVDTLTVEATDHHAVIKAMRGYDVAAGALGPFYLFEELLVRAAIEADVDYVSICDDWTAARDVLDRLDGFIDMLAERGIEAFEDLAMTKRITRRHPSAA